MLLYTSQKLKKTQVSLLSFSDVNYQVERTLLSPLMAAVMGKHMQCVTVLLELGARLDLQDQYGDTVYHYAVIYYLEVIPVSSQICPQRLFTRNVYHF